VLLKSVKFDDDVALLLSVAGLVMGPHVISESEIGCTDSTALRTSWTCLRLCGSCVTSCTSFFRASDPAIYEAPETSITDSSPYISVACQSLQVTWLNVTLEEICFDVVDEAFLWTTNSTLSHSELTVEQPTRQPVVRHSDNMPQPSQLPLEEQVFSRSYSSFLKELSVWYFLPPSNAKDALQTADVKCLEGLDVSSIEGPCLTTVQHN